MKQVKIILFISGLIYLTGCKPESFKDLGAETNKIASLSGNWKLTKVIQTDLIAKNYNYQDPSRPDVNLIEQDITSIAPFTDYRLTLNAANNTPGTFTTTAGNSPVVISIPSGNWTVDNVTYPSKIKFSSGAENVEMNIGGYFTLLNNVLRLRVIKYDGTKPAIQYDYEFARN